MRAACYILLFLLLALLLSSCSHDVNTPGWRPWFRVHEAGKGLVLDKITVRVSGDCAPLPGSRELVNHELEHLVGELLVRRGFERDSSGSGYQVELVYHSSAAGSYTSLDAAGSQSALRLVTDAVKGVADLYGGGILTATAVRALQVVPGTGKHSSVPASQSLLFAHVATLEFRDTTGALVWQGSCNWLSSSAEIADLLPRNLKLLLSGLPCDTSHYTPVRRVRADRLATYYNLICVGRAFYCPALPHIVRFPRESAFAKEELKSPVALEAIVDLLEHAEFAIPANDEGWGRPLTPELWNDVRMGGRYLLGNERVLVLVDLKLDSNGYLVTRGFIADKDQAARFEERLARWQNSLEIWYDNYEDGFGVNQKGPLSGTLVPVG